MTLQESNKPQDLNNFRFQKLFWFLQTGFWSHFDPNPHSFRICPRTSYELCPDNRTVSQLQIFTKLEQQTWPSQDSNLGSKTTIENHRFFEGKTNEIVPGVSYSKRNTQTYTNDQKCSQRPPAWDWTGVVSKKIFWYFFVCSVDPCLLKWSIWRVINIFFREIELENCLKILYPEKYHLSI